MGLPTIKRGVIIKCNTSVGNNTVFMDSDSHFLVNTQNKTVRDSCGIIEIGENNWVGGWCSIKKGTKTPKGTIIAGPFSMVSKDYCDIIPEYSIIGGSPAKLIVENMRRINNAQTQRLLAKYFEGSNIPYQFSEDTDMDKVCLPNE